jgi:hypothetical protein
VWKAIGGFGHVKLRTLRAAKKREAQLMQTLRSRVAAPKPA